MPSKAEPAQLSHAPTQLNPASTAVATHNLLVETTSHSTSPAQTPPTPTQKEPSPSQQAGSVDDVAETGPLPNTGDTSIRFVNATVDSVKQQIMKEESTPKKRRIRTSAEQLDVLQNAFMDDPMPNANTRAVLAEQLGMTPRAVQVWFQNRRAKVKLDTRRGESGSGGFILVRDGEVIPTTPSITSPNGGEHSASITSPDGMSPTVAAFAQPLHDSDGLMRDGAPHYQAGGGGPRMPMERRASTNSIPYAIDTARRHSMVPAAGDIPLSAISEHEPQQSHYSDAQSPMPLGANYARRGSILSVASTMSAPGASTFIASGIDGTGAGNVLSEEHAGVRRASNAGLVAADNSSRRVSMAGLGYGSGQPQTPNSLVSPRSSGPFSPRSNMETDSVGAWSLAPRDNSHHTVPVTSGGNSMTGVSEGVGLTSAGQRPGMEEEDVLIDANAVLEDLQNGMMDASMDYGIVGPGGMSGSSGDEYPATAGHISDMNGPDLRSPMDAMPEPTSQAARRSSWVPPHAQHLESAGVGSQWPSYGNEQSQMVHPDGNGWAATTAPSGQDTWTSMPESGGQQITITEASTWTSDGRDHMAEGVQPKWSNPLTLTIDQPIHANFGDQPIRSPSTVTGHSDSDEDSKSAPSMHPPPDYSSPSPRYSVNRHASLPNVHAPQVYPSPSHARSTAPFNPPAGFPHPLARHSSIDNGDFNADLPMPSHPTNYTTPPASPVARRAPHLPLRSPSSPASIRGSQNSYFPPQGGPSSKVPHHHPYFPTRMVNRRHSVFEQVPSGRVPYAASKPDAASSAAAVRESAAAFLNRANAQIPKHVAVKAAAQAQAQAQQAQQLAQMKAGGAPGGHPSSSQPAVPSGFPPSTLQQQVPPNSVGSMMQGTTNPPRPLMTHPRTLPYPQPYPAQHDMPDQSYYQMHPHQQANALRRASVDYAMARPPVLARSMSVDYGMSRGLEGLRIGSQELGVIVEGEDVNMNMVVGEEFGGMGGPMPMEGGMAGEMMGTGYVNGGDTHLMEDSFYNGQGQHHDGSMGGKYVNIDADYHHDQHQEQYDQSSQFQPQSGPSGEVMSVAHIETESGPYDQPYQTMPQQFRPHSELQPSFHPQGRDGFIPPPVHRGHRRFGDPLRRSMSSPDIWNAPNGIPMGGADGHGVAAMGPNGAVNGVVLGQGEGMDVGIGTDFAMDMSMGMGMGMA
ncbi:hypothetical protein HDV00_003847 [Rhizophlyctis rosea]|nr:hypothetical protein HDV00_003847 [Rhizophlyctis rosea]